MFNKIFILSFLLIFSVLQGFCKELLYNRNFELGSTTYWLPDPSGNSKLQIDTNRVFNGDYSANIYMYSDVVAETYVYQDRTVKPNYVYIGSGYFYDSDFDYEVAYGYIKIIWMNSSGKQISSNSSISVTANSSNWQYLTTGKVIAPSDAVSARFSVVVNKIRTSDSSEKIYIDDLSFVEVGEVKSEDKPVPKNYPNPFNPRPPKIERTYIVIPETLKAETLKIDIYSVSGDKIKTIYTSEWDGKDSDDKYVQPGVYFYIVQTEKGRAKGRMTVVK